MNIYTVRDNLKKTIEGKEEVLEEYNKALNVQTDPLDAVQRMAVTATIEFLKININELKVILFDVEKCCEQYSLMSWEQNPDRSGGQFTQDEINNAGRWQ